jgi:hypothetical protein
MANKSVREVLDTLRAEGLISESEANLKNMPDSGSPWFIQLLVGLGGWIGAIFFFSFFLSCFWFTLGISGNFANGLVYSLLGAICLLATSVHIQANFPENLFVEQFRLVAHLVGHVSLLVGVVVGLELWRLPYSEALVGFLVALQMALFIWLYPDAIFRFLAAIALVIGLNLTVYDFAIAGSLSLLVGILGLTLFYIYEGIMPAKQELEHFELLQSVPYGLAFGFFGTILHELSYGFYNYRYEQFALHQPYISSIFLLILVFWMLIRQLRSYNINLFAPNALFILGLVLLIVVSTLNTPGIPAAILLSLLAFRRKNWILLGISCAFLALFISYFYYMLSLELHIKSYILMGTGLALLLGRLVFQRILPELKNEEAV